MSTLSVYTYFMNFIVLCQKSMAAYIEMTLYLLLENLPLDNYKITNKNFIEFFNFLGLKITIASEHIFATLGFFPFHRGDRQGQSS